jgi:hypothetical protein
MWKLAGKFAKTVIPGVIKPLHVLWNEMIGFIFLVFAITGGFSAFRSYRAMEANPDALPRLLVTIVFALIMGGFAFGSFARARKIARR